ncbi:INP5E-like protein [Mya arenaria]|uniref:INP5E-like protein n=1 Tax=Mya arenaria TaxID=6604 RepID=A0ABY7GF14_MYAAR|nr:INP5E-like protein [Mya arenaria]
MGQNAIMHILDKTLPCRILRYLTTHFLLAWPIPGAGFIYGAENFQFFRPRETGKLRETNYMPTTVNVNRGRKKKSAAAKLAERKRRDSECGSEYGSTVSLQRGDSLEKESPQKPTGSDPPTISGSRENIKSKPRTGLSHLGDLPSLGVVPSRNVKNIEVSPPEHMDIDYHSDEDNVQNKNSDIISQKAPSDATVQRFRAMRMTPDRSRSEESLKNALFSPKPPTTPRSARKNFTKGEKRNRETNSSGEEHDQESKKQNSVISDFLTNTSLSNLQAADKEKMDVNEETHVQPKKGLVIHPDVKEVKDIAELNVNQNMNDPQGAEENVGKKVDGTEKITDNSEAKNNISPEKIAFLPVPDRGTPESVDSDGKGSVSSTGEKKGKKKGGKRNKVKPVAHAIKPLDGSEFKSPEKSHTGTFGSASDLKAISENYEKMLEDSPERKTTVPKPGSSGVAMDKVIPEPKPNAGKLAPIQPKNLPPPLGQDVKSQSLRTTYKADPAYSMTKFFGRSFSGTSERDKSKLEALSHRSLSTGSGLYALPTKEARDRMKGGNHAEMLSSSELDRYFPDRKVGLWDCKEPIDDFLLPEQSEYMQDIYAIGTQENAMSKKEWEILLQETIGPTHVLFHSASHGALHLAVFIRRDLIWFCTVPEDDLVQTRAVTMVKTKGAIAIGFQFFGTSFLFINSHFAPGDEKKKERLDDFIKISKHLNLPKQLNVTQRYDSVFWLGDLNFRIEVYQGKAAVENIVSYIEEQEHSNFEDLVAGDQLTKLIVEGSIFQGFQEGRINFRPTYKYDIGQDTFDTSSKNRIPSYTDRVLFRAKKKNSISCTHYDSPRSITISDHRPVFSIFDVAVQPARECSIPLAAGQFDRQVYTEANRRRSMKVDVIKTLQNEKSISKFVIKVKKLDFTNEY